MASDVDRFWSRAVPGICALSALGVAFLVWGPRIHDPTEGTKSVQVVNDTGQVVRVGFCSDPHCHGLAGGTEVIDRDDSYRQNVGPHTDTSFLVFVPADAALGLCEKLIVGELVPRTVKLSSLQAC